MPAHTPPFHTIVVATDLSHQATTALRYAQALAREHRARLAVVHVIDPVSYAFPDGAMDLAAADKAAGEEIRQFEEEATQQGITVHSVIQCGVTCERILQAVEDHDGDLLILGTRATTDAGRAALGIVARRLLAEASCPVLTVPPDVEDKIKSAGHWRRIVAAVDFSASSIAAVKVAHDLVREHLQVLHATRCGSENCCSNCLERLRFLAPINEAHTVPVDHVVASGDAAEIIVKHAMALHADLILLGSPKEALSQEDFPGSTILQIISRATCPVLCVPSGGRSQDAELIREIAFAEMPA